MRIHFVYAGDPSDGRIQAPFSITRNVFNFLSARAEVVYHQWDATNDIDLRPTDILLGHPHYDINTVVQRTIRSGKPCAGKFLFHPFHHRRAEDNFPFDQLVSMADKLLAICGPYWTDTIGQTKFAHWAPKITRLDMAVDLAHFPFLRTKFNPVGQRNLVYVGSGMPQKNLNLMCSIMERLPHVKLFWYGANDHPLSRLQNVVPFGWTPLTFDMLSKIITSGDVFINTSVSDASPTALLEAASIGFPIACTRESGIYDQEMVRSLSLDDVNHNVFVISNLLSADENSLMRMAVDARKIIEKTHTWDRFNNRLWDAIQSR